MNCLARFVIVLALTFAGCARRANLVVCLFDTTLSTGAVDMRDRYESDFGTVAEQLADGDQLMGDVISANSLVTSTFPLRADLPAMSIFKDSAREHEEHRDEVKAALLRSASELIHRGSPHQRTALLDAMLLAEKIFQGELGKAYPRKTLVVFSDMIEDSSRYNFERERLDAAGVESILEREKRDGRLPDLRGVKVWVAGAGSSDAGRTLRVQEFWARYFQTCGAEFDKSRYSSTLINFVLPRE